MDELLKRIERLVLIACERVRRRAIFLPQKHALHNVAELIVEAQKQMIICRNPVAANAALGAATDAIAELIEQSRGSLQSKIDNIKS